MTMQPSAEPGPEPGIRQDRRPVTAADLIAAGIDLARDFPGQSIADLSEYPVLSEGGWFIVIKNQRTLEEIAAVTGSGRETVKSRLRYALAKLREGIEHEADVA